MYIVGFLDESAHRQILKPLAKDLPPTLHGSALKDKVMSGSEEQFSLVESCTSSQTEHHSKAWIMLAEMQSYKQETKAHRDEDDEVFPHKAKITCIHPKITYKPFG